MIGWLGKSLIAMTALVPFLLLLNFFGKNYGIRPETATLAWFTGSAIGICVFSGTRSDEILGSFLPILTIVMLGIAVGAPMNILVAQAVPAAPNPALPFTIVNAASAVVYVLAPLLAIILPRYFDPMQFDAVQLGGIALVVVGLGLVAYR